MVATAETERAAEEATEAPTESLLTAARCRTEEPQRGRERSRGGESSAQLTAAGDTRSARHSTAAASRTTHHCAAAEPSPPEG